MSSMLELYDEYMTDFERATVAAVQQWIGLGCPNTWLSGVTSYTRFEVLNDEQIGCRLEFDHQRWNAYSQCHRWQGFRHWKNSATPLHPMQVIARLVDELVVRREEAIENELEEAKEASRAKPI